METKKDNQNLTDDQVLEGLDALDVELPDPKDQEGEETADEREKRIRHAFAEQKRGRKQALEIARKAKEEAEVLRKKLEQSSTPKPPNAGGDQAVSVLQQLTIQAMQNLGIGQVTEGNEELVRMERQRLYNIQVASIEQRRNAEVEAPGIVEGVLSGIPQLDDAAKAVIKKRMGEYDVVQRTNRKVIETEVQKYLGERLLAGDTFTSSPASGDDTPTRSRESSTASAAAVSSVRNGRSGVHPGKGAGRDEGPKPATPEEIKGMKAIGATDLAAFRAARSSVDNYRGKIG